MTGGLSKAQAWLDNGSGPAASQDDLPFTDQTIFNLNGTDVPGPLWGIGIHGAVSPYHLFLFAPRTWADQLSSIGAANLAKVILSGESPLPPGCVVLVPGEVVRFEAPLPAGGRIVGLPLAAGVPSTQYENAADPRWPSGAAFVRSWRRDPGSQPSRLALMRVSGVGYIGPLPEPLQANGGDIPAGNSLSGAGVALKAAQLSPQTRTIGIQIIKNSTLQRLTVESVDVEVWWRMASGYWCHNPDDDFTAGGRGKATATHDIELYDVPSMARHVLARIPAGGDQNLGAFFITSEG
jgi:hypothetical protein